MSTEGSKALAKVVGNNSREIGRDEFEEDLVCPRKDLEFMQNEMRSSVF